MPSADGLVRMWMREEEEGVGREEGRGAPTDGSI